MLGYGFREKGVTYGRQDDPIGGHMPEGRRDRSPTFIRARGTWDQTGQQSLTSTGGVSEV
jgi:hypothetical protein